MDLESASSRRHRLGPVLHGLGQLTGRVWGLLIVCISAHAAAAPAAPAPSGPVIEAAGQPFPFAEDPLHHGADSQAWAAQSAASNSVRVLSREFIRRSGAVDLRDLLGRLTSVPSRPDAHGMGISHRSGVDSVAGTALRGLGVGATLLLLNGRRLPSSASPVTEGFDFNAIPLAVVDRIEVIRGGAVADYGDGAIAGVINVITRSDFEGVHVQSSGSTTSALDHQVGQVSLVMGTVSERGAVQLGGGYAVTTPLNNDERAFTSTIQSTSLASDPGTLLVAERQRKLSALDDGRCGAARYPNTFKLIDPDAPPPDDVVATYLANSGLSRRQLEDEFRRASRGLSWLTGTCRYNFNSYYDLIPEMQRMNVYGSSEYEVAGGVTTYAEALWSRTDSRPRAAPTFPLRSRLVIGPEQPLFWLGRINGGQKPVFNSQQQQAFRAVLGAQGDFGGGGLERAQSWHWDIGGAVSRSDYGSEYWDAHSPSVDALLGLQCPSMSSGRWCFDVTEDQPIGLRQRAIDTWRARQRTDTMASLVAVNANVAGQLTGLPTGPVQVSFAAGLRREVRRSRVDENSRQGLLEFLRGSDNQRASRNTVSAAAEIGVPVMNGLLVNVAGRLVRMQRAGPIHLAPKLGLHLNVGKLIGGASRLLRQLHLRATVSQGVAAPSLVAIAPGKRTVPAMLNYRAASAMVASDVTGNPGLRPQRSRSVTAGADLSLDSGLRVQLDGYFHDFRDVVILDNPASGPGECSALSSRPVRLICEDQVRELVDDDGATEAWSSRERLPSRVVTQYRNAARYQTAGIDFLFEARFGLGSRSGSRLGSAAPHVRLALEGTWILGFWLREQGYAFDTQSRTLARRWARLGDVAGRRNFRNSAPVLPRWRLRVPLSLHTGGHRFLVRGRFTSGFTNDERVDRAPYNGFAEAHETGHNFRSQLLFDIGYGYRSDALLGRTTALRVDVINAANTRPQRRYTADGTDLSFFDPRGRMVQLSLVQDF